LKLPDARNSQTGGDALVETLLAHGVETAFGVPGESYLAVIEALRRAQDRLRLVVTRHESGASFAAMAYGRLAGRPGIAFVTRGPGATNAAIGIHAAQQDSVPLVLFIGQVPTAELGREAFQEIDYRAMFGTLTKRVVMPMTPAEVAPATAEALALAQAGRPGPVIVVLPEDVTEGTPAPSPIPGPRPRETVSAGADAVRRAAALIDGARTPLIIAGEQVNFEAANSALIGLAERLGAGVIAAFRRQGVFPDDHAAYLGHVGLAIPPYLRTAFDEADLIIAMGSRLDGATTLNFSLIRPDQTVLQIFPDAAVIERSRPSLGLLSDVGPAIAGLMKLIKTAPPAKRLAWRARTRKGFEDFVTVSGSAALGRVDLAAVVRTLSERLPEDATLVSDAGNYSTWLHRHFRFRQPTSQCAPALGAMGFGVPGALGAQLARPGKAVVAMVGDGGFLMTGQELITAVEQAFPIKVMVCDNSAYGTIAMHQMRRYGGGQLHAVHLKSPDFAAAARAWGAAAWTVEETAAFPAALEAALGHQGPALIHLRTDLRDLAASGLKLSV
jgi:acetolactate synthase-1/2/3 large subunit